jgi:hypothetical protein
MVFIIPRSIPYSKELSSPSPIGFSFLSEVLNPDGKTLQFRYLSALAAKFIDNIRINIDNIRINVDDFPAKLVPLD